ncbi:MAG: M23 family metallopeptidase [Bacillota bacterium]
MLVVAKKQRKAVCSMRHNLLSFCRHIKYVGILGLPRFFSDNRIFDFLWLFWLFGVIEIVLHLSINWQAVLQIGGIIVIKIRYGKSVPSAENYQSNIKYSLPFTGHWTVVNGGITKEFSHSWDIPSQRYAYDFLILDEYGRSFAGDAGDVKSYYCYGKDVLSPADGVVVEIYNNAKDSDIIGDGKVVCNSKDIRGNYILICHADNEYSILAHLQANSILVACGERVVRGQVIAKCGNTGNSSEPHLHFQIQNNRSFYFSAGLPIQFSDISVYKTPNYEKFDDRPTQVLNDIICSFISRGYNVFNNISKY